MAVMKAIGQGVPFQRTRRITGYLVGSLDRFNTTKRCEVAERLQHGLIVEKRVRPEVVDDRVESEE